MARIFQFPSRTVAEVSLKNLVKNAVFLRKHSGKELIPVVKANAYGHGMVPISKTLVVKASCRILAVATLEEALELRQVLQDNISILVLSGFLPHQLSAYINHRITPMIHSLSHLKSLVGHRNIPEIHLKVDTGMHRLGLLEGEMGEAIECLTKLRAMLSGLATHFADSESTHSAFTEVQTALFAEIHQTLRSRKLLRPDAHVHAANTGGILKRPPSFTTSVRPGLGLYGISPNVHLGGSKSLFPVLQWKSRVLGIKMLKKNDSVGYGRAYKAVRDERIAFLPIGYADGYPRLLSNRGEVLIGNKRVRVRGRVSMDLTAVDCTSLSGLPEGTSVTLMGGDDREKISAWDLAKWAQTVPYEILCGISGRVPRVYVE